MAERTRTVGESSAERTVSERVAWALAVLLAVSLLLAGCSLQTSIAQPPANASQPRTLADDTTTNTSDPQVLTYVAIGASDAFGVGASDPINDNWPALLAKRIAAQRGMPVHLVDLGIPGATTAQAVQDELPVAESVSPDIVTILLGTNDILNDVSPGDSAQTLAALIITLHTSYPHALILVGNLPDLTSLPYFSGGDLEALQNDLDTRNTAIADLCARTDSTLVDIYAATANGIKSGDLSSDGLHPTEAGARAIAQAFADALPVPATPTPTATGSATAPPSDGNGETGGGAQ